MNKSTEIATEIVNMTNSLGWKIHSVNSNVLTITKSFTPGDMDEFVKADGEYFSILGLLPQTQPGSMWGTDGGGVGGIGAHRSGYFRMNKSGGSKRVLSALKKMV